MNSSGATQLASNDGYSGVVAVRGVRSPATYETPNVRLFSTNIVTDESPNDKGWFTVALDTPPEADVVVSMLAEDTTEGLLSARGETPAAATTLTLTSANWNVPQWVAVHAVDDRFDDGDVTYGVAVDASSADPDYSALDPADVLVTNRNWDRAVVDVSPTLLATHEYGSSAEFEVALQVPPASGPVYVDLVSSNPSEASINQSRLTFDSTNWNVKQKVTVTGVNDEVADGDAHASIVTSIGTGSSPEFVKYNPADVSVTNIGDDQMTHTYSSGALNLSIPDPGTVSSSLKLADVYSVGDVNVKVNLSHTYDRDLRVYLIGPDGTRVELFTDVGGSGDHFTNTELDDDGAGWGWFVDRTPGSDREFALRGDQGEQNRMDLLTVVMHELGHLLGHDHDSDGVMSETLTPGTRRPHDQDSHTASVDEVFQGAEMSHQVNGWSSWWFDQSESQRASAKRRR